MRVMTQPIELTNAGTNVPVDQVISTFAAHAGRFRSALELLSDEEWYGPTRCESWNVHQLVHHLVTVTERAAPLFDPSIGPTRLTFSGIDPRSTPDAWVKGDGSVSREALLVRYQAAVRVVLERAATTAAQGAEFLVHAPYGLLPWQMLLMHGLWDSWLHERDVFLGTSLETAPDDDEARLVGSYSLFVSAECARLGGRRLSATLGLDGVGGGRWRIDLGDTTSVTAVPSTTPVDARGIAISVFESLCGRGAPLADTLEGDNGVISTLSALGRFFNSSG